MTCELVAGIFIMTGVFGPVLSFADGGKLLDVYLDVDTIRQLVAFSKLVIVHIAAFNVRSELLCFEKWCISYKCYGVVEIHSHME